jgi:uncharacterized protein (TIGR03118 family)
MRRRPKHRRNKNSRTPNSRGNWRGAIEALELRSLLAATGYVQLNLVSDQAGAALVQDPQLVNPAGIALAPSIGDFWVSDTATGVSTLYAGNVAGSPFSKDSLTVTVPGGAPTGQVFNNAAAFNVSSGGASGLATFIFASRSGQISGWSPSVPAAGSSQAITAATVTGAIFTGLAEGTSGGNPFLYAADFHGGKIDVFDGNFATATLAGTFADAAIPAGFAPYNIQNLNGDLFVTYAEQDAAKQNAVPVAGNGIVAEFDTSGNLIATLVTNGGSSPLNAPWGVALAPATFGDLAGDLLVANSGDGKINAFNPSTGAFISTLNDASGGAITIDGIRGLSFGNGVSAGDANTLYFSAGPSGGTHGLFGSLQSAVNPIDAVATTVTATEGTAFSGIVATFNSTTAGALPSNFNASIVWGDGGTTAGTIAANAAGGFDVSATHTYSEDGTDPVSVIITAVSPGTATATATSSASVLESDLTGSGLTATASQGVAFTGNLATFSDASSTETATAYTASINWGDGTTTAGSVSGTTGTFTVSGTHTYSDGGSFPVQVQISENSVSPSPSATLNGQVSVTDTDALSATATATISKTEGQTFSGTVATFSDTNTATASSDLTASINWGDGSGATAGTISGSGGQFTVAASHVYANAGSFSYTVTIADDAAGGPSKTVTGSAAIAISGQLSGHGATFAATEGTSFTASVATFQDNTSTDVAGDFAATINWGDGTTADAGTVSGSNGQFTVLGTHTYSQDGAIPVTVNFFDKNGTAEATAASTANVASGGLTVSATSISASEGHAFTGTVATFTDPSTTSTATQFTATIIWGDGSSSTGTVSGTSGTFTVAATHTYAEEGGFTDVVQVADTTSIPAATASASATATVSEADVLTANGITFTPTAATTFNGSVAMFTDTNTAAAASDFTATINWGDGSSSTGTVAGTSGTFTVSGSHSYATAGSNLVSVVLVDDAPGTAASTATSTAQIAQTQATATSIAGTVFNDLNDNGVLDTGEQGLSARTVFLDENGTGQPNGANPTTTTDSNGNYSFTGLTPGTYTVREVLPTGAQLTTPTRTVTVTLVTPATGVNLGNLQTSPLAPLPAVPFPSTPSSDANTAYIDAVYDSLLGHAPDASGLAFWQSQLAGGTSHATFVRNIWDSSEFRGDEIEGFYQDFLERASDPAGKAFWLNKFTTGSQEQIVVESFLNSAEYSSVNSSNSAFINALYQDLDLRPADASGLSNWQTALQNGQTRLQVLLAFVNGQEARGALVDAYFADFLHRTADAASRQSFVQTLTNPASTLESTSIEDVGVEILTGSEYFSDVTKGTTINADLSMTVNDNSATPGTAAPGANLTYTVVASNAGPGNVSGASVVDSLPAAFTGAAFTATATGGATGFKASGSGNIDDIVNLPSGSTITYTVTGKISSTASGTLSNMATITVPAGVTDPNASNNSATDTVTLKPTADLQITNTDNSSTPGSVATGASLTYTVKVTNAGPSDVTGASVTDNFPSNFTGATFTATATGGASGFTPSGSGNINNSVSLPAGGTITYVVTGKVGPAVTGTIVNIATVTVPAGVTDPNTSNNSATDTDTLKSTADLQINATDNSATPGSVAPGANLAYTIVVTNAGPSDVTGGTVTDTLPANFTGATFTATATGGATGFTASGSGNIADNVDLPAGSTITYVVTGKVSSSATGSLANTATVSVPNGVTDPNTNNNSATDTDTLAPAADLQITATDNSATPGSVAPGANLTYTVVVTNAGPSNVTGASVADTLPANFTGATFTASATGGATGFTASGSGNIADTVNLPAGSTVTYVVTGKVSASATGTLANTATVTAPSGVSDPDTANNSATDTDTLAPTADLQITNTDNSPTPGSVAPGANLTYTIVVTNAGPSNVSGANVADTLPANFTGATFTASATGGATGFTATGSGNIADTVNLPAGSTVTYVVTGKVTSSASGTLANTATVSAPAGVTDPNTANNSATDTDSLAPTADLQITNTDNSPTPGSVAPGANLTYTIVVTNAGPSDVTGASVADTLPANFNGATFTASATGGATGFTASGSGNIADTVNLPAGSTVTYVVSGTVSSSATGTLASTATVTAPTGVTDPNTANNSATDSDTLAPAADLQITNIDNSPTPGSVAPGASLTYTIVVTNAGPSDVTGASVADTLPANFTGATFTASATGGATGFTASGSGNIADTVNLPAGSTITYVVSGTVSSSATGTLANTATVTTPAGVTDPNTANNSATDSDTVT